MSSHWNRSKINLVLFSIQDKLISKMFLDLRNFHEAGKTVNKPNGQFITVKPRTPTVAARFHDSLNQVHLLVETVKVQYKGSGERLFLGFFVYTINVTSFSVFHTEANSEYWSQNCTQNGNIHSKVRCDYRSRHVVRNMVIIF